MWKWGWEVKVRGKQTRIVMGRQDRKEGDEWHIKEKQKGKGRTHRKGGGRGKGRKM